MGEVADYFEAVFGEVEGYAHVSVGKGPLVKPSGKYGYEDFVAVGPFRWPDDRHLLVQEVQRLRGIGAVDVFACPNILSGRGRKRGTAVSRRLLHADVDHRDAVDKVALGGLGGFAVESGQPGHTHVYLPLDREVTAGEYGVLQRALRDYLGADNKIADNDLLRPVGTRNHKATVMDGLDAPYEVAWLIEPTDLRVAPEAVADLLEVDLNRVAAENDSPSPMVSAPTESFEISAFPEIEHAIEKRLDDRSKDTQRIVSACYRTGLRLPQIRWAVAQRPDLQQRLDERPDDDVARIYCALADEQQVLRAAPLADVVDRAATDFESKVEAEVLKARVRAEAKRRMDLAINEGTPAFDAGLLGDFLERAEGPTYRIEGIMPSDSAMLVVAQRKVGKTTLMLNLVRSLIAGEPFLGTFEVQPLNGRVAFLNYEVSGPQLAAWAKQAGIRPDRMQLVNLRSRRDPLAHPDDRARLAEVLREKNAEVLIVDPFARAFGGASQNDSSDVGRWLMNLDRFARTEAGVSDLILTAHAGWYGERSRGSSALEDWADAIITLTKADDEARYLRADGRDVFLEEDRLNYDPRSRLLTLTGAGSRTQVRKASKAEELVDVVVKYVRACPGVSGANVLTGVRELSKDTGITFQDNDVRTACKLAEDRGLIRRERLGTGKANLHYPVDHDANTTAGTDVALPAEESTRCP